MGIKVANNAFGTLAAGINSSVTSITLTTGQGARFPSLGAGDYFYATLIDTSNNLEIVKCTARSTDVLTVVRAQESTTARAYSTGDRIEIRLTAATFSDALDPIGALGYTPVNKAGDTMTGGLTATSLSTNGQFSMTGGGDMSLARNDGFDMSIVMPSSMDSKALMFQRAGGGNLNRIDTLANHLYHAGKLTSTGHSTLGYQHGDATVNALVGNTVGIRTYQQEQGIQGGSRTVTIVQRSTDWNDWTNEFMLLTFICKYYGGGGVGMWYWQIGYGTNTLTQIYNVGDLGISLSTAGPNQVSGRPSNCQFFNLNCTIPSHYGISIQATTNLNPVSSITDYSQFKLA